MNCYVPLCLLLTMLVLAGCTISPGQKEETESVTPRSDWVDGPLIEMMWRF